jgi:hypothetical protein
LKPLFERGGFHGRNIGNQDLGRLAVPKPAGASCH